MGRLPKQGVTQSYHTTPVGENVVVRHSKIDRRMTAVGASVHNAVSVRLAPRH
jgi:hypothetical protein